MFGVRLQFLIISRVISLKKRAGAPVLAAERGHKQPFNSDKSTLAAARKSRSAPLPLQDGCKWASKFKKKSTLVEYYRLSASFDSGSKVVLGLNESSCTLNK